MESAHPGRARTCAGAGLLQKKSQDGTQTTMEATLMAQQTPQQREQVAPLPPGQLRDRGSCVEFWLPIRSCEHALAAMPMRCSTVPGQRRWCLRTF